MPPECEWLNINCPQEIFSNCTILSRKRELQQQQEEVSPRSKKYREIDSRLSSLAEQDCGLEQRLGRTIDERGLTAQEREIFGV